MFTYVSYAMPPAFTPSAPYPDVLYYMATRVVPQFHQKFDDLRLNRDQERFRQLELIVEQTERTPFYIELLEELRGWQIKLLVDDSGSMIGKRWSEATQRIWSIAQIAQLFDEDGLDMMFLNRTERDRRNVRSLEEVKELLNFSPGGRTPLNERLEAIYTQLEPEVKTLVIVMTDGEPNDRYKRRQD